MGAFWRVAVAAVIMMQVPAALVLGLKIGMIGDSGDAQAAQLAFKMMRDAGVQIVLDNGDLDYRNDPGRWLNFLKQHWLDNTGKSRSFLAVSGDHETLDEYVFLTTLSSLLFSKKKRSYLLTKCCGLFV